MLAANFKAIHPVLVNTFGGTWGNVKASPKSVGDMIGHSFVAIKSVVVSLIK